MTIDDARSLVGESFVDQGDLSTLRASGSAESDETAVFYRSGGEPMPLRNWYANGSVFLTLCGPSLRTVDLSAFDRRGLITMGVNNVWSLYRPRLWVCVDVPGSFVDAGWRDPGITKFAPFAHSGKRLRVRTPEGGFTDAPHRLSEMPGCVYFVRNEAFRPSSFLTEATVNWGSHRDFEDAAGVRGNRSVMLAAIKILYVLGFRTVYLLGADFSMEFGAQNYAFAQGRSAASVRGNNTRFAALSRRFELLVPQFDARAFRVFNCSAGSSLHVFPYLPLALAMEIASGGIPERIESDGWYDRNWREDPEGWEDSLP